MKLAAAILAALLAGGIFGYCARGGVSEELRAESARADSLAEEAKALEGALQDTIRSDSLRLAQVQDSAEREIRRARAEGAASERQVIEAGAVLDSTLAALPSPAKDSAKAQLAREREGWRGRLSALRSEMETRVALMSDSVATFQRQRDLARDALAAAHTALDSMTLNRDKWRSEAQKKGLNLGLFRVPSWVGYVGAAGAGVALGTRF